MWEFNHKESWVPKNWCFWTVVLEKTLKSPLDCKEIQPVHPKGNQSWMFMGRTDVEAETLILWPPDGMKWLIWKRPWCWERLKAGGEGDDSGCAGWMASPTQWTWVWVHSRSWWWTERLMLQSTGSQRVRHNWVTEVNWTVFLQITFLNDVYCYIFGFHRGMVEETTDRIHYHVYWGTLKMSMWHLMSTHENPYRYLTDLRNNKGFLSPKELNCHCFNWMWSFNLSCFSFYLSY